MKLLKTIAILLAMAGGIALAQTTVDAEGFGSAPSNTTSITRTYHSGLKADYLWVSPWVADVQVLFDAAGDTHIVRAGQPRRILKTHNKFEIIRQAAATPVDYEWGTD